MKKFKKPFIFSLAILPIAVAAVIFACLYQFKMYPPEVLMVIILILVIFIR